MKVWKARKTNKAGVWSSEISLRETTSDREKKVEKLLRMLEKEGFDASLP